MCVSHHPCFFQYGIKFFWILALLKELSGGQAAVLFMLLEKGCVKCAGAHEASTGQWDPYG